MSLSENFIKNERYLDNWCEQSISTHVFRKEVKAIYGTRYPSGRITPEKQKELLDLVVNDNFFVCWCKEKTYPKPLWEEHHNTPKSTTSVFDIPIDDIKEKLIEKIALLGIKSDKINDFLNVLINDKSEDYWIDEYYGESISLQYIYITNENLKTMIN